MKKVHQIKFGGAFGISITVISALETHGVISGSDVVTIITFGLKIFNL
ncbi:hypothetical protein ACIQY5_22190 [Peribacillus frigoritolerans]